MRLQLYFKMWYALPLPCAPVPYLQSGWTGVHFAAYGGHFQTVRHLVEVCGCKPDRKSKVCPMLAHVMANSIGLLGNL